MKVLTPPETHISSVRCLPVFILLIVLSESLASLRSPLSVNLMVNFPRILWVLSPVKIIRKKDCPFYTLKIHLAHQWFMVVLMSIFPSSVVGLQRTFHGHERERLYSE